MNPHFAAILELLREEDVEFLVIGAHALAAHGHVRAAGRLKDLADLEELG